MPNLKFQNFMAWRKISIEEVMDKLHMLKPRFGKIDKLGWWYLERISADAGSQFTLTKLKE